MGEGRVPYYADDLVTLYHGDCRDLLPIKADVCITDPPYAVSWSMDACRECGNDDPRSPYAVCGDCLEAGATPGHRKTTMLGFVSPNWTEKATHSRGYADHDREAFEQLLDASWLAVRGSLPPGGLLATFGGRAANSWPGRTGVAKSTTTLVDHLGERPVRSPLGVWQLPGEFCMRRGNTVGR